MTDDQLQLLVADAYLRLADLLDSMPADAWDRPSLCELWRVREVVAHVTMPARYDEAAFMAELKADNYDFGQLSNRIAARDGALATDQLLADLRNERLHQWQPPGGGAAGALNHAVVHGLDVTVPLGAQRCCTDDAIRAVLGGLTVGGTHEHFGTDISGRTFVATELDWRYGSGPEVRGTAADIALQMCGRQVAEPAT
jgi:uncharacterized protein (TIGR03083 family)